MAGSRDLQEALDADNDLALKLDSSCSIDTARHAPAEPSMHRPCRRFADPSLALTAGKIYRPLSHTGPLTQTSRGPLHAGAMWKGTQRSGRACYDVQITFLDTELERGYAAGLLKIKGLTPALAELTTFFEAEIIGTTHGFITGKWSASEAEDLKHWSRFPAFRTHLARSKNAAKPELTYSSFDRPQLFMRFKERFPVSECETKYDDHDLSGASFEGFYYVCMDLSRPIVAPALSRSMSNTSAPRSPPTRPGPLDVRALDVQPRADAETLARSAPAHISPIAHTMASSVRANSQTRPTVRRRRSSVTTDSYAAVVRGLVSPSIANVELEEEEVVPECEQDRKADESCSSPAQLRTQASEPPATGLGLTGVSSPQEIPPSPRSRRTSQPRTLSADRARPLSFGPISPSPLTGYEGIWSHARMTGFYHHSSSEPYQELDLRYCGDRAMQEEQEKQMVLATPMRACNRMGSSAFQVL
ncbi:uncharacterized protein L969DRAFT_54813 [Mixia osmundae IAM 14324]|uniref:Uncharacterized protein n=1 Tax=Mixia osmundae (strain CBS 9802 / IAM 14324 / JCM 22182 / KY 12970) TaxID=764103 RepID=G7DW06_MIXOS|nr:uncharacterized protein L969DRAFT_54813 [Mixia osmundae IAM 14324]KEI36488.1 hypothetical protein L969DRAFT_54813 [Mixia osmundae IAM 14324]GAA94812.1 hypothetical protein E5Q_01466 [Mixia osmundae IAM 14324]